MKDANHGEVMNLFGHDVCGLDNLDNLASALPSAWDLLAAEQFVTATSNEVGLSTQSPM